jgi:hypothetical protein
MNSQADTEKPAGSRLKKWTASARFERASRISLEFQFKGMIAGRWLSRYKNSIIL